MYLCVYVCLYISTPFQHEDESRPAKITSRDRDTALSLKEYLTRTFPDAHSLTGLARYFGTNPNKLMTLFKKSFGGSVILSKGQIVAPVTSRPSIL